MFRYVTFTLAAGLILTGMASGLKSVPHDPARHPQDGPDADVRIRITDEHVRFQITLNLAFIDEVSKIIWSGEVDGWNEGDHLARATERAGLDLAKLREWVEADPARWQAELEANHEALAKAGHWGVPTLAFRGEPFFGQDRIDVLVWRLEQAGLSKR